MKGRIIALDRLADRRAAAMLVDGRLEDLAIAPHDDAPPGLGAIFRAIVDRPMKGLGGVFVKLPEGQRGFLRQVSGLAPGRPVLVQVSGHAEPGKAIPVTARLLFKGRYGIFTPEAPGCNVSRRIETAARRDELATLGAEILAGADPGLGLILRSAAGAATAGELRTELDELRSLAEAVLDDAVGAPELLFDAPDVDRFAWCEWADPPPDAVFDHAGAFDDHGVIEEVARLRAPEVPLAGGASMVIEPTRAFIAVDVNTGADTSPAAGLGANVAAARELPRQLRLRGLGGQIVVDFAPMPKRDRARIEQILKAVFRKAAAETSLAGWTALGNYELQRKRDRMPLAEVLAWNTK